MELQAPMEQIPELVAHYQGLAGLKMMVEEEQHCSRMHWVDVLA
jgi:hypothetical protein